MKTCDDCGSRISGGYCVNCHEEVFIEEQYADLDMEIPDSITEKANEHRQKVNR